MQIEFVTSILLLTTACATPHHVYFFEKRDPVLPTDKVFFPESGTINSIYRNEPTLEVRNLLVPLSGRRPRPPMYYNLIKKGENLGQYVLLPDDKLHRINDGRDSTADYPYKGTTSTLKYENSDQLIKEIYIGASDGIYTFNSETMTVAKYGNISDDIIAIDKVSNEDIFYILTKDHKIYKITENGTDKTQVKAVEYASDFVLDFLEGIFYTDEENKLNFLEKNSTVPHKFQEFDFKVKSTVLGKPMFGFRVDEELSHRIPYIVNGVCYIVSPNSTVPATNSNSVPGLTAFDGEYIFVHYYAVDGEIYEHNVLGRIPKDV